MWKPLRNLASGSKVMSPRPWYPAKIGAVAAVYFGAAKLGLLAAVAQKVVSSAWPPTGVALVTLAALVSPLVSATIGVLSLWASGMIERAAAGHLWFVWWSGDAMGDLLIAPLLLAWAHARRTRWPPARAAEAGVLLVSLLGLTAVLLRPPTGDEYAIFP